MARSKITHLGDRECALCGLTVCGEWSKRKEKDFYPVKEGVSGGCLYVHKNCLLSINIGVRSFNLLDTIGDWTDDGKGHWEPMANNWFLYIKDDCMTVERLKAFAQKAYWPEYLDNIYFVRGVQPEFFYSVKKGVIYDCI